jgi:hypothetical protein
VVTTGSLPSSRWALAVVSSKSTRFDHAMG